MRLLARTAALVLPLALALTPSAEAAPSLKKAIWGPVEVNGVSQFPIYQDLGVGIYETDLRWDLVAPNKPANPGDPNDPAYRWPAELDKAVAQAGATGIEVCIQIISSPRWANGGHPKSWSPNPADFAAFARAAARRYPSVHLWMIWGEPTRSHNYKPLHHEHRDRPLTKAQAAGPRRYARLLDAAYAQLKGIDRRNLVIGGNTFTTGDISPTNWVKNLRLPNGKPPRMDLYGHNPFTARRPSFKNKPLGHGFADFSDLRRFEHLVNSKLARPRGKSTIKLFLSEFFAPTDHANHEFNFHVTQATQASWLKSALRLVRASSWIYTLGWYALYDDAPRADHLEHNRGLIDVHGKKKPSYDAKKNG